MKFYLNFILNIAIVLSYFLLLLGYFWNDSGGDIAVWFIFSIICFIHIVSLIVIKRKKKGFQFSYAIAGVITGVILCFCLLKTIMFLKYKNINDKEPIEVGGVSNE